jgi:hypothetical protein
MSTLRERLIKIDAKVVRHGRYITFQLAEVSVPRNLFGKSCGGSKNCDQVPLHRGPRKSTARQKKAMGEVRLDDEKLGRMGFRTRPNRNRRAIRRLSRNAVSLAACSKYNFRELGAYLGNAGLMLLSGICLGSWDEGGRQGDP